LASKTESKDIPIQQQYLSSLQLRLLELLRANGPLTRDQICEVFGFEKHQVKVSIYPDKKHPLRKHYETIEQYYKRTTIYDNLRKLQKTGIVEEIRGKSNGKRGRPPEFWKIREVK